ncbi:MAG: tetratricopeptide repeat protein [Flavobacteriales bacterium]
MKIEIKHIQFKLSRILGINFLCLFVSSFSFSQQHKIDLQKGNKAYNQGQFNNAISFYDSALKIESNYLPAEFNKGNSYYRIAEKTKDSVQILFFKKAISSFEDARMSASTKLNRANANYNMGNAYLSQGNLKGAIKSYKNALRNNPKDDQARYNLSVAMIKLKAKEESLDDLQKKIDELDKKIDELDKQNKKEEKKQAEKEK